MGDFAIVTGQIFIHEGKKCCELVKIIATNQSDSFEYLSESDFIEQIKTEISKEDEYYWFTTVVKVQTEETFYPPDYVDYEDYFEIYEINDVQQAFDLINKL